METLDTATLALLQQLETELGCPIEVTDWDDDLADLGVPLDFDADDDADLADFEG